MKTDLLKEFLDELNIEPITENNVQFAIKKAINNPIYWFCFKRENIIKSVNSVVSALGTLFVAGVLVSLAFFSDWFISDYVGLYFIFALCITFIGAVISRNILVKIASWNRKKWQYMWDLSKFDDETKETLKKIENASDCVKYYDRRLYLLEQRINKTQFVFVKDKDDNRCCINISAIA